MPRKKTERKRTNSARDRPVRPGSTLYRVMELIAREIARHLVNEPEAARKSPARRGRKK